MYFEKYFLFEKKSNFIPLNGTCNVLVQWNSSFSVNVVSFFLHNALHSLLCAKDMY